jgi:methyl-accepting chemotaxis protein-1 (serine sensor receptor)
VAQNTFKTQVQEWKNILIRGHDPAQMTKYKTAFDKSEKEVQEDFAKLKAQMKVLELPTDVVDKTLHEHQKLGAKYRQALATWKDWDPLAYRAVDDLLKGVDRPMNEAIGALSAAIFKESKRLEAREQANMAEVVRFGAILKVTILVVSLSFGFLIARAVVGRIRRSLEEVTEGMERMVAGDFSRGVEVRSNDDLGRMAKDFNDMVARFQELFRQLREASAHVASGSTELSATASEVARATGEIA